MEYYVAQRIVLCIIGVSGIATVAFLIKGSLATDFSHVEANIEGGTCENITEKERINMTEEISPTEIKCKYCGSIMQKNSSQINIETRPLSSALQIQPSVAIKLPATVKAALSKMSLEDQMIFQDEFRKKSKSMGLMVFLAIFFPVQLFVLGKMGLGLIFLFTGGGFGAWYFIEWFLTPKRVRDFNDDLATKTLTDMKIMNS